MKKVRNKKVFNPQPHLNKSITTHSLFLKKNEFFFNRDISFNQLEGLPSNAFRNLLLLHTLYLSNNKITTLDETIFHDLVSLEELDLSENLLEVGEIYYIKSIERQ